MTRATRGLVIVATGFLSALVALPLQIRAQAPPPAGPPAPGIVTAQKALPWAFPLAAPGQTRHDDGTVKTLPGAARGFTVPEINDPFAPPDWYPNEHPPAPEIVARGRKPEVRACGQCHMMHGLGHPESSSLAGLPASYTLQQMEDFKTGARKNSALMTAMAKAMTDKELRDSAEYYASIPMKRWTRIEEADTVPKTYVGPGNMRFVDIKEPGKEPIAGRIIELPEDADGAELRDPHSPFMAYVPVGSIKRGQDLVENGGNNKTVRCTVCHGADLKGMGPVPGLAGRSPIYVVRQLYSFQHGMREGLWGSLMKEAVAKLTIDDMVAIAAYTASREP